MYEWKKVSKTAKTRELLGELVPMWQSAGKSRASAIDQSSKDLGISARKGKCILYDEPHILTDMEALGAECRAENAWLRIADTARQTAEYCEAQAELARIRKRQGDLFERGVGCSRFTKSLRKSVGGLSAFAYVGPIGALCAVLIG